MSLIDWSDPEEMLGLLVEYVDDEASAAGGDADRAGFLRRLGTDLARVAGGDCDDAAAIAAELREIRDAQPSEFLGDHVIVHVDACIGELQRILSTRARDAQT